MRWSLFFLYLMGLTSCGNSQDTLHTLMLGDRVIHVVTHDSGKPGPFYFNMHDDESTSVEAAIEIVKEYGGILHELVHTGARNIAFMVDSLEYRIDPNRIYTKAGIWREIRTEYARDSVDMISELFRLLDSLVQVGVLPVKPAFRDVVPDTMAFPPDTILVRDSVKMEADTLMVQQDTILFPYTRLDSMAYDMVRAFADTLLSILQIDSQQLVVALHNNKEDGYSLKSYLVDSIYEREALSVYIGWHRDPDDFYFVTERRIFEKLQPNDYHIVLQDNTRMTDDGSLSVYCAQRGIAYVNVEAQHKHLEEQKKMLVLLLKRLGWIEPEEKKSQK